MQAKEIRDLYLNFFKSKEHAVIPSASLLPENDPSVLFTTAGMHPLVPFLLGEKHPAGKRLTDAQKCVRTGDIDDVGDNTHLTFFEMLGNWSLGDYWKKEAIEWSFEFLTSKNYLGLDINKLAVTVFAGDDDCPFDQESHDIWLSLGISEERIARLGKEDNWWPAGGKNPGPQGPDSEMFYWTGEGPAPEKFDTDDKRWVEIWNDVFMQYVRTDDGKYEPLKQQNVDTGFGLERATAILQGKNNVYATELFQPLFTVVNKYCPLENEIAKRIVVDHLRTSIFIMADDIGVKPSNVNQGYVVRKLLRRAIRNVKSLQGQVSFDFINDFYMALLVNYKDIYPELKRNQEKVVKDIVEEHALFIHSLEKGFGVLLKSSNVVPGKKVNIQNIDVNTDNALGSVESITGGFLFDIYQSHSVSLEDSLNYLENERGLYFDPINKKRIEEEFFQSMNKHQELSRTASAGMFKGGLAGHTEQTTRYHTATHLLHKALKMVLGDHVQQKGSNITDERMRFDFSHGEKMTPEQIKQVEEIVNKVIQDGLNVSFEEMSPEQAKDQGAVGLFGDKYGEVVKVYSVGEFSKEICGGPHVHNTNELGIFKITKEEASSSGVRRIKAILT